VGGFLPLAAALDSQVISTQSSDVTTLPALGVADLIASLNTLQATLPGLSNVTFQDAGDGTLRIAVPGAWDQFHWNSADWQ
jgi:hypothetical protein